MGLYDPAPPGYHQDFGWRNPIQDSVGYITPAALHFVIAHGYEPPDIDPAEHHLLIHGLVEKPLIFSLDDLKRFPSVTRTHFLECNANGAPAGPTGEVPHRAGRDRAGHARLHELQPVDGRLAFDHPESRRRETRGQVDHRRGLGKEENTRRASRSRKPRMTC